MSAWVVQRPPKPLERHARYLACIEGQMVSTTEHPVLALRFASAMEARTFVSEYEPHFDDWKVVRR